MPNHLISSSYVALLSTDRKRVQRIDLPGQHGISDVRFPLIFEHWQERAYGCALYIEHQAHLNGPTPILHGDIIKIRGVNHDPWLIIRGNGLLEGTNWHNDGTNFRIAKRNGNFGDDIFLEDEIQLIENQSGAILYDYLEHNATIPWFNAVQANPYPEKHYVFFNLG